MCKRCVSDSKVCNRCLDGYFLKDNQCLSKTHFPVRHGIDSATMSIKPCADSNCVNCVDNYQTCTECDTANGYILVSGSCRLVEEYLQVTPTPAPLLSDDIVRFEVVVVPTVDADFLNLSSLWNASLLIDNQTVFSLAYTCTPLPTPSRYACKSSLPADMPVGLHVFSL